MKYCKCGCNTIIPDHCTWVKGHHGRGKKRTAKEIKNMKKGITAEKRKKISERLRKDWKAGKYDSMFGDSNPSKRPEIAKKIGDANRKRIVKKSTKDKIRKSRLGKPGFPMSEERKKESSIRMKKDNPMYRKEVLENHPVLKSGRYFISLGEKQLSKIFNKMNLKYHHQKQIKKEKGYYTVDFFFPKNNKIIEFDEHHSHRENPEYDQKRDKYIKQNYGYDTLRILPRELNNSVRSQLILKIRGFLYETN